MARAKRTDRAEARRRFRAQQLAAGEAEPTESDEAGESLARPARQELAARPIVARMTGPKGIPPLVLVRKPGQLSALRSAYLPWDIRGDLRLLRPIALRTPAVLVPVALTVVAGFLFAAGARDVVSVTLFSAMLALAGPATGGPFLAGVMTPRAGWLVGLIAAFAAWAVTSIALFAPIPEVTNASQRPGFILSALTLVPFGALLGAFGAWYRRLLKLTGPQRPAASSQRRPARSAKNRPATRQR